MTPNEEKILEAIVFLIIRAGELSYEVTVYDLAKSLFLADRSHLNMWGRPVTFDNYVAMQHGPAPSTAYNFLKKPAMEVPWIRETTGSNECYRFVGDYDFHELSASDKEVLSDALLTVRGLTFGQIRRLTHEDPAYINAWEDDGCKNAFPMSYALLFETPNEELAKELAFASENQ
jgi:uncharacterized phage-associated protein